MNPTWKAAIGIILIFILGWFGGALTTLIIVHHKAVELARDPQAVAITLMRQTTHGLGLNDSQKAQLRTLLLENVRARMELQRQIQPQVWIFNRKTMDAINVVLTPDQQQKFQDNLILFKSHYGRNPLTTGTEETTSATNSAPASPASNAPVGSPPAH